jgi:hypothetical protein
MVVVVVVGRGGGDDENSEQQNSIKQANSICFAHQMLARQGVQRGSSAYKKGMSLCTTYKSL